MIDDQNEVDGVGGDDGELSLGKPAGAEKRVSLDTEIDALRKAAEIIIELSKNPSRAKMVMVYHDPSKRPDDKIAIGSLRCGLEFREQLAFTASLVYDAADSLNVPVEAILSELNMMILSMQGVDVAEIIKKQAEQGGFNEKDRRRGI